MDHFQSLHTRDEIARALAPLEEQVSELAESLRQARTRIERLELYVESLLHLAQSKGHFSSDEWQVMLLRTDLYDGVEDGKRNALEYRGAPVCPSCKHYVNPQRSQCVYCDAPLVDPATQAAESPYRGRAAPRAPEPKRIPCMRCHTVVPQTEAYFSKSGELICADCFQSE